MSGREFAIILIDTSKRLFLSIQYPKGIEWSFGICAISSALRKSNISDEQPRASMSLSRPLSRQIQDLEGEMGFLLFDRLPRGVRLSAAGKLFLSDARRILQDVDEAKRRAELIALGSAGTLRIGIAMALSWHGVVVDAFREFRRRQPDVELVVHHLLSVHQVDAVLSDRLDAGVAATITPWHKDLAHRRFAQEGLLLAVPKGHPLTKL